MHRCGFQYAWNYAEISPLDAAPLLLTLAVANATQLRRPGRFPDFGKEGHMFAVLNRLIAEDAGQDLAEYGIALAVIGALAAGAAVLIAGDVNTLWSRAQNVIGSAV